MQDILKYGWIMNITRRPEAAQITVKRNQQRAQHDFKESTYKSAVRGHLWDWVTSATNDTGSYIRC